MVNGGRCLSAGSWAGRVVPCERGDIAFVDKVNAVKAGGGVAAVIYNNVPGGFTGTLGTGVTSTIPAISMSRADGQGLVANSLSQSANVGTIAETNASGYAYLDGTSMASPHAAGAAAIIWSANPSATNLQVRNAMTSTALDLGAAGRDNYYGNGLVQTFDATEALLGGGGTAPVAAPSGLTATSNGTVRGSRSISLAWSGGAVTVDVYRNNSRFKSAINNTGSTSDSTKVKGTLTYKVCNAGSTTSCSANASSCSHARCAASASATSPVKPSLADRGAAGSRSGVARVVIDRAPGRRGAGLEPREDTLRRRNEPGTWQR